MNQQNNSNSNNNYNFKNALFVGLDNLLGQI